MDIATVISAFHDDIGGNTGLDVRKPKYSTPVSPDVQPIRQMILAKFNTKDQFQSRAFKERQFANCITIKSILGARIIGKSAGAWWFCPNETKAVYLIVPISFTLHVVIMIEATCFVPYLIEYDPTMRTAMIDYVGITTRMEPPTNDPETEIDASLELEYELNLLHPFREQKVIDAFTWTMAEEQVSALRVRAASFSGMPDNGALYSTAISLMTKLRYDFDMVSPTCVKHNIDRNTFSVESLSLLWMRGDTVMFSITVNGTDTVVLRNMMNFGSFVGLDNLLSFSELNVVIKSFQTKAKWIGELLGIIARLLKVGDSSTLTVKPLE